MLNADAVCYTVDIGGLLAIMCNTKWFYFAALRSALIPLDCTNCDIAQRTLPIIEIQFQKLGFLTLNSNERSGFQARELKSVTVNSQLALLKMLFHENH